MPITLSQKAAIEEVIYALLDATSIRSKRPVKLAAMFMDLVDRVEWPAYYDVIPEPRCLSNIQAGVEKGRYREATDVYTDLSLVFWNALFYNESDSQIAVDAGTLKALLETEWRKRSLLPHTRASPPPSSAQKVHGVAAEPKNEPPSKAMAIPAPPLLPVPTVPTRTATQIDNASSTIPIHQHASASDPDVDIIAPDSDCPKDNGPAGQTAPTANIAGSAVASSSQIMPAVPSQNPYQVFRQPYVQQQPQIQRSATLGPDRSIITAAGGIAAIGGPAQVEKLSAETVELFDRDPITNEVLWFAAPPMNMSRARGPSYSLEYLMFIATKRKAGGTAVDSGAAGAKRPKMGYIPTVSETMREVWKDMRADGYYI